MARERGSQHGAGRRRVVLVALGVLLLLLLRAGRRGPRPLLWLFLLGFVPPCIDRAREGNIPEGVRVRLSIETGPPGPQSLTDVCQRGDFVQQLLRPAPLLANGGPLARRGPAVEDRPTCSDFSSSPLLFKPSSLPKPRIKRAEGTRRTHLLPCPELRRSLEVERLFEASPSSPLLPPDLRSFIS